MREAGRLEASLKAAAQLSETIIAALHYPPDEVYSEVMEKYNVYKCVFGHLHGKSVRADKLVVKNGVKYYLTSCDQVDNKLTEILL